MAHTASVSDVLQTLGGFSDVREQEDLSLLLCVTLRGSLVKWIANHLKITSGHFRQVQTALTVWSLLGEAVCTVRQGP